MLSKMIFLAYRDLSKKWTVMPIKNCPTADGLKYCFTTLACGEQVFQLFLLKDLKMFFNSNLIYTKNFTISTLVTFYSLVRL